MSRTRTHTSRPQPANVLLPLLLLIVVVGGVTGVALVSMNSQLPPQRFFYAGATPSSSSQTKVRLLRQVENAAGSAAPGEEGSCCQEAAAAAGKPLTLPLELVSAELGNVTTDYDISGETSSKENFKRHVTRSAVRNATPASCSPQPTIVELKPPGEQEANFYYTPSCTRINRCNGCCGSTLISCQATEKEIVQLRVRKVDRAATRRSVAIVDVEQHLACRCDCRIKADDCNVYQSYRKDLCRCECHNTDARDKCLEQAESKYWDDANCTCACRYNQSCTTGTVFDEAQCKCTDPSASIDVLDRKRFIVQAVQVNPDNTTLYSV